jgi:hypothetical protein
MRSVNEGEYQRRFILKSIYEKGIRKKKVREDA